MLSKTKQQVHSQLTNPKHTNAIRSIVRSAGRGAASVVRTGVLRRDRVSEADYRQRLDICRRCPGGHATFRKDGSPHTCGPMVQSMADRGRKTCGCVLGRITPGSGRVVLG